MGLVIKRRDKEECFLFVTEKLMPGDYIKMRIYEIGKDGNGYFAREGIDAPKNITILREKIVAEEGGLESIIEQINSGTFKFKTNKFKPNTTEAK